MIAERGHRPYLALHQLDLLGSLDFLHFVRIGVGVEGDDVAQDR